MITSLTSEFAFWYVFSNHTNFYRLTVGYIFPNNVTIKQKKLQTSQLFPLWLRFADLCLVWLIFLETTINLEGIILFNGNMDLPVKKVHQKFI